MTNFVKIKTLFNSTEDRTISDLSKYYKDYKNLASIINELISDEINENLLKNKTVLLKPNWVKHSTNEYDEVCLRTHDSFILAVLYTVLQKHPNKILIGDAPIQGCNWDAMISSEFLTEVSKLRSEYNISISIKDFRRATFDRLQNNVLSERNPISDYIIFDLGKESFLEPITDHNKNKFRVTDYNPDRFIETHSPGVHKYCITKSLFESDIIISLPKVKTHQKTGITAALKNIVGLNGDKDFLPHHRIGGTGFGGDCYPGKNPLRFLSELILDNANRHLGKATYWFWLRLSSLFWKLSLPQPVHNIAAAWYGNDTTWRMVMDLNKIVRYGKPNGTMEKTPIRQFFSLCDGIIGGQGDGPLFPSPLPLGIISFTNNSYANDIAMAKIMGFDINKIPLLNNAKKQIKLNKVSILLNKQQVSLQELTKLTIKTTPPPGWVNYL